MGFYNHGQLSFVLYELYFITTGSLDQCYMQFASERWSTGTVLATLTASSF